MPLPVGWTQSDRRPDTSPDIHRSHRCGWKSIVTLQHGDIVERERIALDGFALSLNLYHGVLLQHIILLIYRIQSILYFTGQHIGKEPQASHVDPDDGRALSPHPAGGFEERSVAAHGDDIIHIEVVIIENSGGLDIQLLGMREEIIERAIP